ncbi:MAG: PD-(D/E)XK nuclease family protein [Desulfomonile tiedjei]|nr:PD-(D/E)XK nuclease family protein [Desulfomonile tiedjei]
MAKKDQSSYSFSRLELYAHCPWAYKKIVLDRLPRVPNEAMITGQILHSLIAEYLKRLISQNRQTDWQWAEGINHEGAPPDVSQIWQRFYNSFILPPGLEHNGVEHRLAFDRDWQPCEFFYAKAYFRMVLDWFFQQGDLVVVIDWKSGRKMPADIQKDLQLRIYGWGLKQAVLPDSREILLRQHFLRYGREQEVLLNAHDLDEVPHILKDKIRWIEGDQDFEPTPGSFCGLCGVTAHCPVMAGALISPDIMAPATRKQAETAATLLLTLQKMEKELSSRLKEWVKVNGPVPVGNLVYGETPYLTYDFDARAITARLLEAGLSREEVWGLLSISKNNLERFLKKARRPDLLADILAWSPNKRGAKIGFTGVKNICLD